MRPPFDLAARVTELFQTAEAAVVAIRRNGAEVTGPFRVVAGGCCAVRLVVPGRVLTLIPVDDRRVRFELVSGADVLVAVPWWSTRLADSVVVEWVVGALTAELDVRRAGAIKARATVSGARVLQLRSGLRAADGVPEPTSLARSGASAWLAPAVARSWTLRPSRGLLLRPMVPAVTLVVLAAVVQGAAVGYRDDGEGLAVVALVAFALFAWATARALWWWWRAGRGALTVSRSGVDLRRGRTRTSVPLHAVDRIGVKAAREHPEWRVAPHLGSVEIYETSGALREQRMLIRHDTVGECAAALELALHLARPGGIPGEDQETKGDQ